MEFNNQFNQFCGYIPIVCKKRQNPICSPCTRTKRKTCIPCPPCPTPSTTPSTNTNDEYNTPEENKPRRGPPIDKPVYVDDTPTIPRNMATGDDLIDKTISDFINIPQQTITDTNDNDDANSTWDTTTGIVKDVFLSENVDPPVVNPTDPSDPTDPSTYYFTRQYTSDYSDHNGLSPSQLFDEIKIQSYYKNKLKGGQDPDSVLNWLTKLNYGTAEEILTKSQWDGTPIQIEGRDPYHDRDLFCADVAPVHKLLPIGIRDLFYEINPFADINNPTAREIDSWNLECIRHFRRLFGIGDYPVEYDARLCLGALWAMERNRTDTWDYNPEYQARYNAEGEFIWRYGPCYNPVGSDNFIGESHCGNAFFPNEIDRARYIANSPYNNDFVKYPELQDFPNSITVGETTHSQFITIPWSLRMPYALASILCADGLIGHSYGLFVPGHTLQYIGLSWWYNVPDEPITLENPPGPVHLRIHGAGESGVKYPLGLRSNN